jgi:dihydroxyacetone kinase-like protein
MEAVSIARLTAWLSRFETLLDPPDSGPGLARGMAAVLGKIGHGGAASVGELFTAVGMTLVGSASGPSGPLYGTFFLRFGMDAGAVGELDAAALSSALRAGQEGAVERGTAALGETALLETLSRGARAFGEEIAGGSDAATAASTAAFSARAGTDERDASAVCGVLLFEALATALSAD